MVRLSVTWISFILLAMLFGCSGGGSGGMAISDPAGRFGYLNVKAVYPKAAAVPMRAEGSLEITVATIYLIEDIEPECESSCGPERSSYMQVNTLPYGESFVRGQKRYVFAGMGVFDFSDGKGLIKCLVGEQLTLIMAMKDASGITQKLGITTGISVKKDYTESEAQVTVHEKDDLPPEMLSSIGLSQEDLDVFEAIIVPQIVARRAWIPNEIASIIPDYEDIGGDIIIEDPVQEEDEPEVPDGGEEEPEITVEYNTVDGNVYEQGSSTPVPGAGVFLIGSDGLGSVTAECVASNGDTYECSVSGADYVQVTDEQGYFLFEDIAEDTYEVVIIRDNILLRRIEDVVVN